MPTSHELNPLLPLVARTTESIFHQNIIIMLAPGKKGLFEKTIIFFKKENAFVSAYWNDVFSE